MGEEVTNVLVVKEVYSLLNVDQVVPVSPYDFGSSGGVIVQADALAPLGKGLTHFNWVAVSLVDSWATLGLH